MNEVIFKIFNTGLIDEGVSEALKTSIALGAILAPTFYLMNVVWNFSVTTLKNFGTRPTSMFDRMELIRASILWFILTVGYIPIFGTIVKLGDTLGRYSVPKSSVVADGKGMLSENYNNQLSKESDASKDAKGQQQQSGQESNASEPVTFWDLLRGGWNTLVLSISGAAWGLASVVVRSIVLMFAIILAKIFYVIGPVVIAFSILPVFKEKFSQWSGVFLNCLCVPFTMNLLDTIIFSVIGKAWTGEAYASPYSITIFGVCMTVCYALAFWITSFYCGSSGASKIMSTAVTAATQGASMVLARASGASTSSEPATAAAGGANIIEDKQPQQPTTK
jgi:hypothetical protein